jgi:proteic killer suppression protein
MPFVLVIRSFQSEEAERLFDGWPTRRLESIARVAQRKLGQRLAAHEFRDLAIFPGNRLEALSGDRRGQHSIRVNDRFRVGFVWRDGEADDVEIVDHH